MSLYLKTLDHGTPLARKAAHLAVSAALALLVAVPLFAVGMQVL